MKRRTIIILTSVLAVLLLCCVIGGIALAANGGKTTTGVAPTATTVHQSQPTATTQTPRPTATSKPAPNVATLGGSVAAFQATEMVDKTCHLGGLCFCASDGDTSCDFLLGVTPATGRVTEVDLEARGNWPLDQTLTWCLQFMPEGSSITSTQDGITEAGFYLYSSSLGRVSMQIAPGSCELTFA
jgi:hypothetical protein